MRMHQVVWTRTVLQTATVPVIAKDAMDAARLARKPSEDEWQGSGVSRRPHVSEVREPRPRTRVREA